MKKLLVISSSLNPQSRSRILAKDACQRLQALTAETSQASVEWVDLSELDLPPCDGATCYANENAQMMATRISEAHGVLMAVPIYNFQSGSSAKNLIELTGKAWENTVAGFICAAGGQGSYMSIMTMANSLMLDFRTFVIPRFVYATGDQVNVDGQIDEEIEQRIQEQAEQLLHVTTRIFE